MKHFNFNQLSPCVFDNYDFFKCIKMPDNLPIGEFVTVGRKKNNKVVFIPCEKDENDKALEFLDMFPELYEKEGFNKIIQFNSKVGGYLFGYINIDLW